MSKQTTEKAPYPLTIRGKRYEGVLCHLKHESLKFYVENPRVYSALHGEDGEPPSQDEIYEHLQKQDHVRALREEIKVNGGLIEPVYVKEATFEVVEGNSRLAAYRLLADDNAVMWEQIKCVLLPKDLDESAIASLLGQLHIRGKRDWIPYEEASYLHRRHRRDKISIKDLAKEIGLKDNAIQHRIAVIDFMVKHKDNRLDRWSYYDVILKSTKISKARTVYPEFEETVVEKIKSGEIKKAVELRDKLKVLCDAPSDKPMKQFIAGQSDLDGAFKQAKSLTGDHKPLKAMKNFRLWLVESATKQAVKSAAPKVKDELLYELRQIKAHVTKLLKIAA